MRAFVYGLISIVVLAVAAAAAGYFYITDRYESPGPLQAAHTVVLERGAGARAIADRLAEEGVLEDAQVFLLGLWLKGEQGALKAGEYAFEPGVSPAGVAAKLVAGDTVIRRLTIAEGLTSAEIVALVDGAEGLSGEIGEVPPDGTLLPETYHFSYGDARRDIIARMKAGMAQAIEALWPKRQAELPLNSPEEAVTLASIVEKETGVASERPMVAGVFVNRLRRDMPLQSDPTVIYALTMGKAPLGRPLARTDLEVDSPFNTYRYKGLPPAPIANPGRASLEATLNPADTDALYFVADGSGGHAFARTLDEHNRNVRRWRELNNN
ncbi:MAG: endolytic transglycosylase MltG [Alphaproteobacteria bacterium]